MTNYKSQPKIDEMTTKAMDREKAWASLSIRDKPIWMCSKCNTGIYAKDIGFAFFVTSRRIADQPIMCPSCRHVDKPGEVRKYD